MTPTEWALNYLIHNVLRFTFVHGSHKMINTTIWREIFNNTIFVMTVESFFDLNCNKLKGRAYLIRWLRNARLCPGRRNIMIPQLSRMHRSSLYLYTSLSRSSIKLKEERCLCNQLTKPGSHPTWGVCVWSLLSAPPLPELPRLSTFIHYSRQKSN